MGESGAPPGTLSGSFGGGTELTGAGPVTLGELDLDGPALVEVEARGIVPFFWAFGEDEGKQFGALDPAGHSSIFGSCSGNVVVSFSSGGPGGVFAPCDAFNVLPLIEAWTDTLVTEGGTVEARRASGPRGLTLRNCGKPGFPCYNMKGTQTVRVSVIADQLQVEADQTHVAAGTSVNFTASTKDGTRLEIREWIWVPDEPVEPPMADLLPEGDLEVEASPGAEPSASMAPDQPVACGSSPVCQFPVLTDGTMYVRGVAGGVIQQAGVGVTVRAADLVVECAPSSVVRAEENVVCTASTEPEEVPFMVSGWRFVGVTDDGTAITRERGAPALTWEGRMLIDGEVTVIGEVQGAPDTARTTVDVVARDWNNRSVSLTVFEDLEHDLANPPQEPRDLGEVEFTPAVDLTGRVGVVPDGPNASLAYLTDVPLDITAAVHINRAALWVGSEFWRAQPQRKPAFSATETCTRDDVVPLIEVVIRHEGLNIEPDSHVWYYKNFVEAEAGPGVEHIVSETIPAMFNAVIDVLEPIGEAADVAADAADPLEGVCTFRYR